MFKEERGHLGCSRMERLILGADAAETEKLIVGDSVYTRGCVGGSGVQITVGGTSTHILCCFHSEEIICHYVHDSIYSLPLDNWDIFWCRGDLHKRDDLHLNWSGIHILWDMFADATWVSLN